MGRKKSRATIELEYDRLCGAVNAVAEIERMLKKFSQAITSYGNELELEKIKLRKALREIEE